MQKVLAVVLTFSLFLGLGTNAYAAKEDKEVEKAIELINRTNEKIDQKIEKAVEEAEKLQENYLLQIRKLEEKDLESLTSKKDQTQKNLTKANEEQNKVVVAELTEVLRLLEEKILSEQKRVEDQLKVVREETNASIERLLSSENMDAEVLKLNQQLVKEYHNLNKYEKITENYRDQLDQIITKLFDQTLEMSEKAIEKAKKAGVEAECTWFLVLIGDQWVWIDPIRVVGRN